MTRIDGFLRCLASGDADNALVFWRARKGWSADDRAKVRRLLTAAVAVAGQVLG